ncbi:MAG: DUF58 domain-containing protein [Lachnospiraceae bacterium]|nr:DUF58 domain-containing protein [Lachnospiraceae bacterium]
MWKNRIIYILCICAGTYYAVLYDKYVSLAIMWCIITIPLFSLLCLFFFKKRIKVETMVIEQMVKMGEDFFLTVITKNHSIFPVSYSTMKVKYKNQLDGQFQNIDIVCRVDAKSEERIQLEFHCNHCGLIEITCEYLRIYDYFRLFSVKIPIEEKEEIIVIPEFEIMEDLLENPWENFENIKKSIMKKGEDSSEIINIREYHPGDHPKSIHWKLSSKKGQLLIKEFAMEEDDMDIVNFGLVCEEEECNYEWYDEKLEELVNICWTLLQAGRMHKVIWYHPQMEIYENTKIQSVEDLGELAKQVICAGVGRLNKEDMA